MTDRATNDPDPRPAGDRPGLPVSLLVGASVGAGFAFLFSITENHFSYHLPQEEGRIVSYLTINYWYHAMGLLGGVLCGAVFSLLFPRPFGRPGARSSLLRVHILFQVWVLTGYSALSVAVPQLLPTLFIRQAFAFPGVHTLSFSLLFPPLAGLLLYGAAALPAWAGGPLGLSPARLERAAASIVVVAAVVLLSIGFYLDRSSWAPSGSDVPVEARSGGRRPNVVLIVMDTLRADHLSCYGYDRRTSPNLDRLCEDATVFTRAFAPSNWTGPSHASLFTGLYPFAHGMTKESPYLGEDNVTLAELLSHLGYYTAAFTTNPWISRYTGLARGFGEFHETWRDDPLREEVGQFVNPSVFASRLKTRIADLVTGTSMSERVGAREDLKSTSRTTEQTVEWLRSATARDEPFFLFANFMETHLPYLPPADFYDAHLSARFRGIQASDLNRLRIHGLLSRLADYYAGAFPLSEDELQLMQDLYDAAITYLDTRIAEILAVLEQRNVIDETIVIVTSDHGESFGDHGLVSHDFSLYDSLLRNPLIVRYPALFPAGARVDKLVQNVDLLPTLLEILDLAWQAPYELQGVGLLPIDRDSRSFAFAQDYRHEEMARILDEKYPDFDHSRLIQRVYAYRQDGYKYVLHEDGADELYRSDQDPNELVDLSDVEQERVAELRSRLDLWVRLAESAETGAGPPVEMSEEMRERLRSLGYLK